MGNNNDEDREEYYDYDFKKKLIDKFNAGQDYMLSSGLCTEKEMKENEKGTTASKAEKGKNVVDDASDDDEYILPKQQQGCSSSGEAGSLSPDSPLPIKPLASRSPSTSYKVLIPLPWVRFPTKRRTVPSYGWHDMEYEDRKNKCQKIMEVKSEDEQNQQRKEKKKEVMKVVNKGFIKRETEELVPKKLVKKSPSLPPQSPPPPPSPKEMPNELRQAIAGLGGTSPLWLTEKKLTETDVKHHHGRLFLLNVASFMEDFLKAWEKEELTKKERGRGLNVLVVDTRATEHEMDLRIWESLTQFVFAGKWNSTVSTLDLKSGDTVQLWIFRLPAEGNFKICFPMNVIRRV